MQHYKLISGLVWVAFTCGVCPISSSVDPNNVNSNQDINKRQGLIYSQNVQHPYQHYGSNQGNQYAKINQQYSSNQGNQYANIKVLDQRASSKDYNTEDDYQDVTGSFTSDASDRQDIFGGDTMTMFAMGVAVFAAGAATYALIQNADQASKFDSVEGRLNSLESDQTNICTTVKGFASATDGVTVAGGFDDDVLLETGYILALAAVSGPTCS